MEESPLNLGLIYHQQEKERTTPRCTRRDRVSLYRRESQYSFSCPRSFLLAPSEGLEPSTRGLEHRCRSLWLRGEREWQNVLDSNQRSDGKTRCLLSRKVLSTTQPTFHKVAGLVRFELTVGFPTSVFKTGAISRSATNPGRGSSCKQPSTYTPGIDLTVPAFAHYQCPQVVFKLIPIPEHPDAAGRSEIGAAG